MVHPCTPYTPCTPCTRQLEEVKKCDYVDYIRPPIDKYGTLQFDAFDEIRDIGYYHGRTYFAGLRKAGQLWFGGKEGRRRHSSSLDSLQEERRRKQEEERRFTDTGGGGYARFTDLAEMVCRVRQATPERLGEGEEWEEEEDSEPNSSDILTDPEDFLGEDESGFLSQEGGLAGLGALGLSRASDSPAPRSRASSQGRASSTRSSTASRGLGPRRAMGASHTTYNLVSGQGLFEERRRASCDSHRSSRTKEVLQEFRTKEDLHD